MIRHAMTDSVANRTLSGRAKGVFLNEQGKAEARDLAERLKNFPIRAVYSSPLERAVETAEAIAQKLNLKIEKSEAFEELEFGDWTGRNFDELENEPKWRRFNLYRSSTRIPNGELMLEAQVRFVSELEKLRENHSGEIAAVVSHSDLIKAAIAHYAGIHLDLFGRIEISPASVSIVKISDAAARIIAVNYRSGFVDYQNLM